jgi:excisionase family DNA binding protein
MEYERDEWLAPAEAARYAEVSYMTLHRAAEAGALPFLPTRLGRLFAVEDVTAWSRARQNQEVAA